jgi:aspartate aminotransferase
LLEDATREALSMGETNYPPSDGVLELRRAVISFYEEWLGLSYPLGSVLITGGSRPGIHATYSAVVDPGDAVVYPVPSWNNNHYCQMVGAVPRPVVCGRADAFLPSRDMLEQAVRGARLLALNSPSNPAGTAFTREALEGICELVLEENERRGEDERPLFLMYDQVYWMLTFGGTQHVNPVSIRPAMSPYTIFVDGISKSFAATGVRVGWVLGPTDVVQRMGSIVGHIGAWAPRAEQVATGRLLGARDEVTAYSSGMKAKLLERLNALHLGITSMKSAGLPVDSIPPMGAIYLSARFNLIGRRTPEGDLLSTNEEIRRYLLKEASLGVVPFQAFGSREEDGWFRLSVGAVSVDSVNGMLPRLRAALERVVR